MRKLYAEPYPVMMSGSTVAVGRSYGTREKLQATALRYGNYGRTAITILFWLKHTLQAQCVTPVIRPAFFNS